MEKLDQEEKDLNQTKNQLDIHLNKIVDIAQSYTNELESINSKIQNILEEKKLEKDKMEDFNKFLLETK